MRVLSKGIGAFTKAIDSVERTAVLGAAALLLLMTLAIGGDVASRLFANESIPGVVESTTFALVFVVYAGFAQTERMSGHVAMTFLAARLPARIGDGLYRLGMVLSILVLGWMTYATTSRAKESFDVGEFSFGLISVPVWPGRMAVAAGLALLTIEAIRSLLRGASFVQPTRPLE